jgi:hypothetical protein
MKRILALATVVVALALAGPSPAAPPPGITADPFTNYLLVRVLPNGTEKELVAFEVTSWDSQEQLIRTVAFQAAQQERTNNPSWRLIMYGPIDPPLTYWTDDDRIWDSAVNG